MKLEIIMSINFEATDIYVILTLKKFTEINVENSRWMASSSSQFFYIFKLSNHSKNLALKRQWPQNWPSY